MRNTVFLILLALLFGCNGISKKNRESSNNTQQKKLAKGIKLIGAPFFKEDNRSFIFENVQTLLVDLNGDRHEDTILIEKIKDWNDPGDFHRVTISITGGESLSLLNTSGWVTTKLIAEFIPDFNVQNLVKSQYVTIKPASENNMLLLFKGYYYASHPGILTIVNIVDKKKPILIFNENVGIYAYEDFNKDGIMDLATIGVYKQFFENGKVSSIKAYLLDGGFSYNENLSTELIKQAR